MKKNDHKLQEDCGAFNDIVSCKKKLLNEPWPLHSLSNIQGCEAQLSSQQPLWSSDKIRRRELVSTDEEAQLECQFYASSL